MISFFNPFVGKIIDDTLHVIIMALLYCLADKSSILSEPCKMFCFDVEHEKLSCIRKQYIETDKKQNP
jgi:hypothetical protein